jgi:type I restriction enzyme S subunit
MEVKPGYKQTEVGVIPEHWDAARLGDKTTKVGSGITPTGGARVYKQEGRPFLRSQNVGWGNLLLDDVAFIDDETHATFQDTEVEADDVFLNITGASIGRSAVADARVQQGNVNQHVCIIRTDQAELLPRFLNHFLLSTAGQRQVDSLQAGGNRQGLNFGQVKSFLLPLPPPPEQRAIAEALSDADAFIESLRQLLAKKRQVKQGAMQELLAGQRRLPGFSGDWEVKRLGDCFALISTRNEELNDNVVTISAQQGFVRQEEFFKKRVASSVLENYYLVERDHFAYNRGRAKGYPFGAIKRLTRYDKAVVTTLYVCFAVKPEAGVTPTFFEHYFEAGLLNSGLSMVTNEGGRAHGLLNITKADFLSREIKRPPLPEQTAIAGVLSDMDAEIAALEAKLAKARQIKQGMMQELLTGRIRLV